jgi:hypothetical protein
MQGASWHFSPSCVDAPPGGCSRGYMRSAVVPSGVVAPKRFLLIPCHVAVALELRPQLTWIIAAVPWQEGGHISPGCLDACIPRLDARDFSDTIARGTKCLGMVQVRVEATRVDATEARSLGEIPAELRNSALPLEGQLPLPAIPWRRFLIGDSATSEIALWRYFIPVSLSRKISHDLHTYGRMADGTWWMSAWACLVKRHRPLTWH